MQLAQNLISCTHLFKKQNAVIVWFSVLCLYYTLSVSQLDFSLYSPKHPVWLTKQWLQLSLHPLACTDGQFLSFPACCLLKFCPLLAARNMLCHQALLLQRCTHILCSVLSRYACDYVCMTVGFLWLQFTAHCALISCKWKTGMA